MRVKALTIHQPWASLIALGYKKLETRSWRTRYRGPIAIHAGKKLIPVSFPMPHDFPDEISLPLGAFIGIANLSNIWGVRDMGATSPCYVTRKWLTETFGAIEEVYGDLSNGRFAWDMESVETIEPILEQGRQGLWNAEIPDEIYARWAKLEVEA